MPETDGARDPARLRQKLRQTEEQRALYLRTLLAERGPLIRGSFVVQPGRCGKPSCKCARGEFHSAAALYIRAEGRRVCIYVPLADRERVERLNRRDRRFREARAALAKLTAKALELADALHEALTEPYPPAGRPRGKARKNKRRPERREEPSS